MSHDKDEASVAGPQDFEAIARLVHGAAQDPKTQCIHSATGEDVSSLVAEMHNLHASGELVWITGMEAGRIISAFGAEFDTEAGRAWLRGPIGQWEKDADDLWRLLRKVLPETLVRFDTFLNADNQAGQTYYKLHGFKTEGMVHVYTARRARRPRGDAFQELNRGVLPLNAKNHSGFAALHDATFPETFIAGTQIITKMDEHHRVWVYAPENRVLGYLYGTIEPWKEEGYIEFLGVERESRGKGIGGALLQAALHWFFDEQKVQAVGLTVSSENVNARSLYARIGFQLQYTGVNQRLLLPRRSQENT